jgi:hydrogenase maturation factor HypE
MDMKPIEERFWAKVDRRGLQDCWPWLGYRHHAGMGQIGVGRRQDGVMYVSRLAWQIANGPIPRGQYVLHKCDNPGCVNPNHLFLGTYRDNIHDMLSKRRHVYGAAHPGAKLNDAKVRSIRASSLSDTALAHQHGVSRRLIWKVRKGLSWKLA